MTDKELEVLRQRASAQYFRYSEAKQKSDALGGEWCSTLREIDKEEERRKIRAELIAEMEDDNEEFKAEVNGEKCGKISPVVPDMSEQREMGVES